MPPVQIVLVEPLGQDFAPSLSTKGNTLGPVALEWLAGYIDSQTAQGSYEVAIIQQRGEVTDGDLLASICHQHPDVVGFSLLTPYYERVRSLARELKSRLPSALVVVGGQHPSIWPQVVLDPEFDVAVVGEGEVTFLELLEAWRAYLGHTQTKERSPANWMRSLCQPIPGTVFSVDGSLRTGPPRARVRDLDRLAPPRREAALLEGCRQWNVSYPTPERQRSVAQVSWSRGCTGTCSFCVSPTVWRDSDACTLVVTRRAESVLSEIQALRRDYGTNYVYFTDLSFNAPVGGHSALMSLCSALQSLGPHGPEAELTTNHTCDSLHWFALCKVGISDEEASAMARAGCSKVGVGIESFRPDAVNAYRKQYGLRLRDAVSTLANTDRYGIINRAYIILGQPDDPIDIEDITVSHLLSLPVDQVRLAFLTPYPGTALWERYRDRMITHEFSRLTQEEPVVRCDNFTSKELVRMRQRILQRFYTDGRYEQRCKAKVERFPWLRDSYNSYFRQLRQEYGIDASLLPQR